MNSHPPSPLGIRSRQQAPDGVLRTARLLRLAHRTASQDQEEEEPEEDPKPAKLGDGDRVAREPERTAFRENDRHAITVTYGPF